MSHASGTTLLATPPPTFTTWSASRYSRPSTATVPASNAANRCNSGAARWIALTPIHGRALWARAPCERRAHMNRPLATRLHPPTRRFEQDREVAREQIGVVGEQVTQAVVLVGDLFAFVEHQRDFVRRRDRRRGLRRPATSPRGRPSCRRSRDRAACRPRGGAARCRSRARCRDARRARPGLGPNRSCGRRHCSRSA